MDLTPVESRDGISYKREDYFAPMGYGGINGSKLRQLIHLIEPYYRSGGAGVITGASVLSPQISMGAMVAKHYGLPITVVMGGTKPATAQKHENVAIAASTGADFVYHTVGYNPALQKAVEDLHKQSQYSNYYRLCYGITTDKAATAKQVEAFHAVGAQQVLNIPDHIEEIYMPAGSCNSCVSVLYGLVKHQPKNLKRIILVGIGPNRLEFIQQRLWMIELITGLVIRDHYRYDLRNNPELQTHLNKRSKGNVVVTHYDLHTTKYTTYQEKVKWEQDGIEFHPTYEGKVMKFLQERRHDADLKEFSGRTGKALFWIVGSKPSQQAMTAAIRTM